MNKFFGTGEFQCRGETRKVHLCLNLDENVIEVWHPMSEKPLIAGREILKEKVALSNVHFHLPTGKIVRDHLADSVITSYGPGTWSIYDSTLARAMGFLGEEVGMTKIVIKPRHTEIEFNFEPFTPTAPQYELFYQVTKFYLGGPHHLLLNPGEAVVKGDEEGIAVIGHESLLKHEERIRLCLGILRGGPVTLRSTLDAHKFTIHMFSQEGSGMGPLVIDHTDIGSFLQGLFDFFSKLSPTEWARWRIATYFYLQGLGAPALEVEALSLFSFLEILDNTNTLSKQAVATLLNIKQDEAQLLCLVRHGLIHRGERLGAALVNAHKQLVVEKQQTPVDNSIFPVTASEETRDVAFFLQFCKLMNQLWATKANFTGRWNDYSEYTQ